MVKDGTYLIGTNCIVTPLDIPMIYQSHILKFRVVSSELLDPLILFFGIELPSRSASNPKHAVYCRYHRHSWQPLS